MNRVLASSVMNHTYGIESGCGLSWPHPIVAALQARSRNSEFLHFVDQRSAFQAEFGGSAFWATDYPTNSFKCLENDGALGIPQSSCGAWNRKILGPDGGQRVREDTVVGKDDRSFDQV